MYPLSGTEFLVQESKSGTDERMNLGRSRMIQDESDNVAGNRTEFSSGRTKSDSHWTHNCLQLCYSHLLSVSQGPPPLYDLSTNYDAATTTLASFLLYPSSLFSSSASCLPTQIRHFRLFSTLSTANLQPSTHPRLRLLTFFEVCCCQITFCSRLSSSHVEWTTGE
jgi:hypothetical protein